MKRVLVIVGVLLILLLVGILWFSCSRSSTNRKSWPCLLSEKSRQAAIDMWRTNGVDLSVTEPVGVERKGEPVTSGVPLPEGCVKDVQDLCLFSIGPSLVEGRSGNSAKSKPIPCQFTVKPLSSGQTIRDESGDVPVAVPKTEQGPSAPMKSDSLVPDTSDENRAISVTPSLPTELKFRPGVLGVWSRDTFLVGGQT